MIHTKLKEGQALKTLSRELYDKFVKTYLEEISKQKPTISNIIPNNKSVIISCNTLEDAKEFVKFANKNVSLSFNKFIEKETGENCKKYHRTLILFTSTINENNSIIFTWQ